jgi:hypothetical protein
LHCIYFFHRAAAAFLDYADLSATIAVADQTPAQHYLHAI